MKITQLSVFVENAPGHILAPCRALADAGVNLRALSLADAQNFGILRMIVSDWRQAATILEEAGFSVKATEVLAVEVPDRPGGLSQVLGALAGIIRQHRVHVCLSLRPRRKSDAYLPLR